MGSRTGKFSRHFIKKFSFFQDTINEIAGKGELELLSWFQANSGSKTYAEKG
jgi:hypothetical protein